jgi:hypothetical protein
MEVSLGPLGAALPMKKKKGFYNRMEPLTDISRHKAIVD